MDPRHPQEHGLRVSADSLLFFRHAHAVAMGSLMEQSDMKTMTCRELGGSCDKKLNAETWDEMVKLVTQHVMEAHPDVATRL